MSALWSQEARLGRAEDPPEGSKPPRSIVPSDGHRSSRRARAAEHAQDRVDRYLRHIRRVCANLAIRTVHLEPDGQRSDVLVLNNSIVFRFPRTSGGVEALAVETTILRAIRGRLPLATPDPAYENVGRKRVGAAFVGYPRLPGEPFWRDTLLAQDDTTRGLLAGQLARFLKALHSVPADSLQVDLPVEDGLESWADMYRRIRNKLFSFMRPESQTAVARHFERYLDAPRSFDYEPALRHGDFGPSNILFDRTSGRIIGVIDFGSAGLGDPALDLAGLISPASYGEPFLNLFTPFYPELQALLARARFYAATFALQEALWGIEHNDPEAFESGIARYR
jgi:aminoglycoside 2''-phosphotransferase